MTPQLKAARASRSSGFTLIEIMIVVAIIATLAVIAFPLYRRAVQAAEGSVAVKEIKDLQNLIDLFEQANGALPLSLDDLEGAPFIDPWGNEYQYLNFSTVKGKGKYRKDKALVPINTTYDLYSMGPDGESTGPLTAEESHDDIVRANDGDYVGIAALY